MLNPTLGKSAAVATHVCAKEKIIFEDVRDNRFIGLYAHGRAIGDRFYNFGDSPYFWTDNDEYTTPILYCPHCGLDLRTLLKEKVAMIGPELHIAPTVRVCGKYFDELISAMDFLGAQPDVLFLGQSVRWDGHALFKTLKNVPQEKRVELPVIEDFQMGFCTGLALEGIVPVSIFPRWDFLILATNQLVNHLDKVPHLTNGEIWPKVIIRTSVGSVNPLNPGPQHCQDHTDAFRKMLQTVTVVDLMEPEEILPAYQEAYLRKGATLLVEHMDFYNAK